ncbi:uncharacterized protein LOC130457479 [Monodelphis domestica]|uniref:uncharacterized protein LOC130457479 n=1 Tax=Monodelphis domestica TaxID=13616 RepID=UPI0024E22243|nr:uncharacterized protein LOC130457479 [Monodelphis domestica]
MDLDLGIYIKYQLDGSLFDLCCLTAKSKTTERLILEALFADDCALMAHQENHLQTIVDRFSTATKLFGLTINLSKTEVLYQPAPGRPTNQPCITINSTQLSNVNTFKYLGSTIANDGSLDHEINARIQKASQALRRLLSKVLQHRDVSTATKLKVYNAVVLSSLLYDCETRTLYRKHMKQLEQFHQRSLQSIIRIRWQDRITNQEVLDRANSTSIEVTQLQWSGHVICMDPQRIPRQVFYGDLSAGLRKQGRPMKRFKDQLKSNLKWAGITPKQLELAASDRSSWRTHIHHATTTFEDERRRCLAAAHEHRHHATPAPPVTTGVPCPMCHRLCASAFGLQSHMRVHRR